MISQPYNKFNLSNTVIQWQQEKAAISMNFYADAMNKSGDAMNYSADDMSFSPDAMNFWPML